MKKVFRLSQSEAHPRIWWVLASQASRMADPLTAPARTRDEFLQLGDGPICAFAAGVIEVFHLLGREFRWRVRVERLVRSGDGEDLLFQSFRFGG